MSEIDKGMYSYSTLQLLYILFHMYIKCSRIDNNIHGFLNIYCSFHGYGTALMLSYTFVKALLMLNDLHQFWSNICCYWGVWGLLVVGFFFIKTVQNHILHIFQQHGSEVIWVLCCLQPRPARSRKHLVHYELRYIPKEAPNLCTVQTLYQPRTAKKHFTLRTAVIGLLSSQMLFLFKRNDTLHWSTRLCPRKYF